MLDLKTFIITKIINLQIFFMISYYPNIFARLIIAQKKGYFLFVNTILPNNALSHTSRIPENVKYTEIFDEKHYAQTFSEVTYYLVVDVIIYREMYFRGN